MKVALVTSIPHGGPVEHAVLLARDLAALGVDVRAVVCDERLAERFARRRAGGVIPLRHQLDCGRRGARAPLRRAARTSSTPTTAAPGCGCGSGRRTARARAHAARAARAVPRRLARRWRARLAYGGLERRLPTDVLVAPSHAAARLLRERVGYARQIVVVPNGVDRRPRR